jgi:ABC-type glycerol-3-phosphate transport system substrate-binding protein
MRITRKKKIAAALVFLLGLGGAGMAYAYWTNVGSGDGSATTGTNSPVTVVQTSTVSAMYPGDTAQTLAGTFNNPNPGATYVAQVTVAIDGTGSAATALAFPTGCSAADYTLVQPAATNADVLANDTSTWGGGSIRMNNLATNQDACKNVVVHLHYTSN